MILDCQQTEPLNQILGNFLHTGRLADHPDPILQAAMKELEDDCIASKDMGRVTYLGVFASGERQSNWVRKSVPAGGLLRLIETREAEKVLACIGSSDRLNLLLALLKKPMTVNQLVEECGCRSTGQVYHHLKPLLAADLVEEDTKEERKGYYAVRPHRVQGIIMLLAGVSDMLDPAYARGSWDSSLHESRRSEERRDS